MDTLKDRLDEAIGDGPPLPAVSTHLLAGRRALKRRRWAGGAVALTTVTVLVMTWFAVAPGRTSGADADRYAGTSTSGTVPATTGPTPTPSAAPWDQGELVRYVDGQLEIRPGVVVHEHIPNPYDVDPPSLSDALDVTWKGQRQWLIIESRPAPLGTSLSSSEPSNGWADFASYVADQVSVDGGDGWPKTFRLDGSGRVVATPGTQVHQRSDHPGLGPDFAAPGEKTGAAVVTVPGKTGSYFVVWRVIEGKLEVITTPPTFTVGATFEELLTMARAQYASGEGLR